VPAFITGDNAAGRTGDNSPPSSVEIKNEWDSNYPNPMSLHGVERVKYIFLCRGSLKILSYSVFISLEVVKNFRFIEII
jgi:hypothetical protein